MLPVVALHVIEAAALLAIAVFVLARARWSVADTALIAASLLLGAEAVYNAMAARAATADQFLHWERYRLLALALQMPAWLLFSLTYARVNARQFVRRWQAGVAALTIALAALVVSFRAAFIAQTQPAPGGGWNVFVGPAGMAFYAVVLAAALLILMNLERTYRASIGTMRWRIKFIVLGTGLLFVARAFTCSQVLLFHGFDPSLTTMMAAAALVAAVVMSRSLFRGTHLDTDVYPSQLALERSLTLLLAGIYLLVIGVLAKVAARWGGGSAFAIKAFVVLVALLALAITLQSDRIRLRFRRVISRHFERPLYDYRTVWRQFNHVTAHRVDRGDLCRSIVRLLSDLSQALSVAIWVLDDERGVLTLSASTSVSDANAGDLAPTSDQTDAIIAHVGRSREPIDIEALTSDWAQALRQMHPRQFPNGGDRIVVPMVDRAGFLGLIVVGDRVSGLRFSLQDYDLLQCAADHAAASLRNVEFSRKLLQAKELEAFQTMAAFFVHDLKNSASTLGLMLQNLPEHFDDPEFRQDALRGIGKTVTHINGLISRLSLLRHELKIRPGECDLNVLVAATAAELAKGVTARVITESQPLPKLQLDEEQVKKVLTNLILNASEASPPGATVRITTERRDDWVVVSVIDQGCGMTAEFMQRSLFRPFQTSKKHGLGIGMFQSKMIVEAHGGRIVPTSEPGRGSTFAVWFRVSARTTDAALAPAPGETAIAAAP